MALNGLVVDILYADEGVGGIEAGGPWGLHAVAWGVDIIVGRALLCGVE